MRVGTDTGGTFTDLVDTYGRVVKVLSSPEDPADALRAGLDRLQTVSTLAHGTTVATNVVLQRAGDPIALVTNAGLTDVIEIGRQDRPRLYDQWADRPEPLVARRHRYGIRGRLSADGSEIEAVGLDGLAEVDADVAAVAICLLHADLDSVHEAVVAAALSDRGLDPVASHQVAPEFREFERMATTVINAYLRAPCRSYLERLDAMAERVGVLTSAGGLIPVPSAASRPASLLLSGPAGGVRAAADLAVATERRDAVSFDMGGTSTDVCLILDGRPAPAGLRAVDGHPVRMPSLDIHTIGAGGGSIATVDAAGALLVGPCSAGADPGPACYGRGGVDATVTDANLVAGHIPPDATFGDLARFDLDAARTALERLGLGSAIDAADGVLRVVDAAMEQALRAVTVERGVAPSSLALIAFSGTGPLHACPLAERLDLGAVVIPARAGVFSAVGVLAAPDQHDIVRSWPTPLSHEGLDSALAAIAEEARAALGADEDGTSSAEVTVITELDVRYEGQSHEIRVPTLADFAAAHERRNGFARPDAALEVIALRATAGRPSPVQPGDLPAPERRPVRGPTVTAEQDTTIWVPSGWQGRPGPAGALVLERC